MVVKKNEFCRSVPIQHQKLSSTTNQETKETRKSKAQKSVHFSASPPPVLAHDPKEQALKKSQPKNSLPISLQRKEPEKSTHKARACGEVIT